MFDEFLNLDSS